MHRCFIDPGEWNRPAPSLSRAEAHYLLDVLRLRPGETVMACDGRGRQAPARIARGEGGAHALALLSPPVTAEPPACAIMLLQAVPKGQRMDVIVEKATELGVSRIVPLLSERVVARPGSGRGDAWVERWRRVALAAARQCARAWVPEVAPPAGFDEAVTLAGGCDLFLFGSLAPRAIPLGSVLRGRRPEPPRAVALLIGPEGDLTDSEYERAERASGIGVSFGTSVLRTDTAALYGLSVLAYELLTEPAPRPPPASG